MEEQVNYRTVELEKFKLVALQYLDEKLADFGEPPKLDISAHTSFMLDQLVLRLQQCVWGREVERQECQWPADWWQALKERWFPAWAKKRWPIEYKRVVITARELYPQMAFPPHQHAGVIAVSKSPSW